MKNKNQKENYAKQIAKLVKEMNRSLVTDPTIKGRFYAEHIKGERYSFDSSKTVLYTIVKMHNRDKKTSKEYRYVYVNETYWTLRFKLAKDMTDFMAEERKKYGFY